MNPRTCRLLSTICFQFGIISIFLSIGIWWFLKGDGDPDQRAYAERFGIFVGLWAPTLLILSNRFDRYADKAKTLPGHQHDHHEDNVPAGDD
ncbi:MAG: hypothetical protein AAF591_15385 [Verrucomicrobiota bacterium]